MLNENVGKDLAFGQVFIFYKEVKRLDDLLFEAAKAWEYLLDIQYVLNYGMKDRILRYVLKFRKEDFFHLAGFQYLNDINIPKYSKAKYLEKVIDRTILGEHIRKSLNYDKYVKPRLEGLILLNELLHSPFKTYIFRSKCLNFGTEIKAKFLITNPEMLVIVFLFVDENTEEITDLFCRSIFIKDSRDYTQNQKAIRIMYKEITGKEKEVFIDKIPSEN